MSIYFVSQSLGSDSYNGLYETHTSGSNGPWKTVAQALGSTPVAGDTVYFRRGDTWREQLNFTHSGGTGNPITYDCYGSSGALPLILGSAHKYQTSDWVDQGSNIWKCSAAVLHDCGNIIFNDEAAVGVKKTTLGGCTTQGDFFNAYAWPPTGYPDVYMYSVGNPGSYYSNIELAQWVNGGMGYFYALHDLTVQNFDLRYGARHGFSLVGSGATPCHDITIQDNRLSFIGGCWDEGVKNGSGIDARAGSGIQFFNAVNNITFRRNILDGIYEDGFDIQCYVDNLTLGHFTAYQNVFRRCTKTFEYTIGAAGCTISDINFCHNIGYQNGYGWQYGQRWYAEGNYEGLQVWNSAGTVTNSKWQNNIIHTIKDRFIYAQPLDDLLGLHPDYNCYYNSTQDPNGWKYGSNTKTFATWKTAVTPDDAHSLNVDPKFVDPLNGDFHLQSNSPCIGAAVDDGLGVGADIGMYAPSSYQLGIVSNANVRIGS